MSRFRQGAALLAMMALLAVGVACSGDDDSASAPDRDDERTVSGPPIEELDGAELYEISCSACHQAEGAGIEGVYPPLAGSAFVALADPFPVAQTVLHGRAGMPAWGTLTDTEIAAILTYLRTELNDADAVDPEVVMEARDRDALEAERRDADGSGDEEDQGD